MYNLQEEFSKIYDQNIEKIYRFIYLKVNSQETAEDLTSKVFLKGWEAYKNQKEIKNPRAFLYQTAKNAVIDFYREKGRTKIVSTEDYINKLSDPRTNTEERIILNSDLEIVKRILQNLDEDYQNVVIWHYLDDLSISEIAKIWNKSEGAVRVTLHRALKFLRNEIEKISAP